MIPPALRLMAASPAALILPAIVSAPLAVNVTLPPAPVVEIVPAEIAPVLLILTFPPPLWLMLVIDSGAAVLTSWILPLVVLVALNAPTVFALPSVVPPAEVVINALAIMVPAPASLMTPGDTCCADARLTAPVVLTLPAFNRMSRPANTVMPPEVLLVVALNRTSLVA